ncbi:DUF4395 family protein [Bailinhaonella thermotolerans]|uniref:DUF4395 family protein n=1 Tax=Bailinhaonella thermotolerans TaxID=1070861 RepID=A0A3A4AWR0_9ACTN|nr:DUF4395 family protein [Bailinhaonella thermotolerans]
MHSLFRKTRRNNPEPANQAPARFPQRWALILSIATALGVLVGVTSANVASGIATGVALVALLHTIIE